MSIKSTLCKYFNKSMMTLTKLLTIFISLTALQLTSAWNPFNVKWCPEKPQLFTALEIKPFLGKWYNHLAMPNIFEKGKCGSTNYYYEKDVLYNIDKELRGDKWVNSPLSTVTLDTPGVLTAHMFLVSAELNVLDTDYSTYAIVYSCRDLYITNPLRIAWVLTRKPVLTEEEKKVIYAKAAPLFKSAQIELSELEPVIQDCKDDQ